MNRTACPTLAERFDASVEQYADTLKAKLPPEVRELIGLANTELYHGPIYLDGDGEECSCFEADAKQFKFSAALDTIKDALDNLPELRQPMYYDAETDEVLPLTLAERERGRPEIGDAAIMVAMMGPELVAHL